MTATAFRHRARLEGRRLPTVARRRGEGVREADRDDLLRAVVVLVAEDRVVGVRVVGDAGDEDADRNQLRRRRVGCRPALRRETCGGIGRASLIGCQAPHEPTTRGYPRDRERALDVARFEARRLAAALGFREKAVRLADRDCVRLGVLVGVPERRGVRRSLVRHARDEHADSVRTRQIRRILRAAWRMSLVRGRDARHAARVGHAPLDVGAGDARHGESVRHRADVKRRWLPCRCGVADRYLVVRPNINLHGSAVGVHVAEGGVE